MYDIYCSHFLRTVCDHYFYSESLSQFFINKGSNTAEYFSGR